jgi:hypothetical protein
MPTFRPILYIEFRWFWSMTLPAGGYWPGLTPTGWNKSAGREATSTDLPINASKRVFTLALGSLDPSRVRARLQTLKPPSDSRPPPSRLSPRRAPPHMQAIAEMTSVATPGC